MMRTKDIGIEDLKDSDWLLGFVESLKTAHRRVRYLSDSGHLPPLDSSGKPLDIPEGSVYIEVSDTLLKELAKRLKRILKKVKH